MTINTSNDKGNETDKPEKKLSILGLKAAGKSTFLAVLMRSLSLGDSPSRWEIIPEKDDIEDSDDTVDNRKMSTNDLIYELENQLFADQVYPNPTLDVKPMSFRAKGNKKFGGLIPGGNYRIKAGDVPGEAVLGKRGASGRFRENKLYENYIKDVSAVIFLLDPMEMWVKDTDQRFDYYPLIRSILTDVINNDEDVYVAFGVTKVDDLPKEKFLDGKFEDIYENIYHHAIAQNEAVAEKIAKRIIGEAAKDWVDHHFKQNASWWLISATGFIEDENGNYVSQSIERELDGELRSGIKDKRLLRPIGVTDIVEWTLDKLAQVDENNRPLLTGKIGRFIESFFQK